MKKLFIRISFILLICFLLFFFRFSILKLFSNFLIVEDKIEFIDNAFVLSGGAFDRGNKVAQLINENKIGNVICTGANQPPDFKALKIDMLESELTRKNIIAQIEDSTKVQLIKAGTSTLEESDIILDFCKKNQIKECVIVSSSFHTRRIYSVFKKKFLNENIEVKIIGAPSSSYQENFWWQSENGLIALNNEYVKLVYYAVANHTSPIL